MSSWYFKSMIRAEEPIFDLTAMASSLVDVLTSKPYDMTSEAGLTIHAVECLKVQVRNSYNKKLQQVTQIWQEQKTRPMRLFFGWGQISHLANAVRRNACGRWTVGWCLGSPRVRWVCGRLHLQLPDMQPKNVKIRLSFWWIIWWERLTCVSFLVHVLKMQMSLVKLPFH